jgi:hypothetical protein
VIEHRNDPLGGGWNDGQPICPATSVQRFVYVLSSTDAETPRTNPALAACAPRTEPILDIGITGATRASGLRRGQFGKLEPDIGRRGERLITIAVESLDPIEFNIIVEEQQHGHSLGVESL